MKKQSENKEGVVKVDLADILINIDMTLGRIADALVESNKLRKDELVEENKFGEAIVEALTDERYELIKEDKKVLDEVNNKIKINYAVREVKCVCGKRIYQKKGVHKKMCSACKIAKETEKVKRKSEQRTKTAKLSTKELKILREMRKDGKNG